MGASLIEIKRRIQSTKKTSQITNAMQMVSGAKLARSEQFSRQFQQYAGKVREVLTHLIATELVALDDVDEIDVYEEDLYHDLLLPRDVKKTGYLVITSDKGLAGGYNSTVCKHVLSLLEQDKQADKDYVCFMIGGTGIDFFKARNVPIAYELRGLSDQPSFDEVRRIVQMAVEMYHQEVFDELYVCYNHHVNSLSHEFRAEKMLPITDLDAEEISDQEGAYEDFLLEPSKEAILDVLLPQFADSTIYGAILDAKTAEHAARMTAMKSATDNAGQIIDGLTMTYNRARQAAITQEITEIVGGASALE